MLKRRWIKQKSTKHPAKQNQQMRSPKYDKRSTMLKWINETLSDCITKKLSLVIISILLLSNWNVLSIADNFFYFYCKNACFISDEYKVIIYRLFFCIGTMKWCNFWLTKVGFWANLQTEWKNRKLLLWASLSERGSMGQSS